jgi:hypothetical protein
MFIKEESFLSGLEKIFKESIFSCRAKWYRVIREAVADRLGFHFTSIRAYP